MTLSSSIDSEVKGQNYYLITTTINEPQEVSNIVQLPTTYTKNVLDENIKYQTMEYPEPSNAQTSGSVVTVTFRTNTGEFASEYENDNFILSCPSDGKIYTVANHKNKTTDYLYYSGWIEVKKSRNVTVAKQGTNTTLRRSKIVKSKVITVSDQTTTQGKYISLNEADVFRLISVKMCNKAWGDTPFDSDVYSDITDRYTLLDGQTDTVYGISKLMLKNGYNPPSNPIRIEFEYFDIPGRLLSPLFLSFWHWL